MAHSLYPLVRVNAGEWSPSLDNRLDLDDYRGAARRLRNVIPTKQGGAQRRPGTVFSNVGKVPLSGTLGMVSLRKFQYAPGTTFVLQFVDKGIRFISNGAQVTLLAGLPNVWISGTSYPNGAFASIGIIPELYYLYNGPLTNSTVPPNVDNAHWVSQSAYEVPAPYSATNFTAPDYWSCDVCTLQILQINDVVYIVHPNFPVYKLTRYADTNWVMQEVQFLTPAMMDENATDLTITAAATSGTGVALGCTAGANWLTGTYYVPGNTVLEGGVIYSTVQAHTSGTFSTDLANLLWQVVTVFASGNVGGYFQLAYNRPTSYIEFDAVASGANYTFSGGTWVGSITSLYLIGTWEVQTYGTWQGIVTISVSYDNGTSFQVVTSLTSKGDANYSISGQEYNGGIYEFAVTGAAALASTTPPRVVLTADNQFVYGLVLITAVGGPYNATCSVITPLYATTATQYWSEGAWSTRRGFPQAITIFQERVWYGYSAAEPQRVWATQTDDIENFALIDQSQATYGLAFDLNAAGRGPIQWLAAQTDLFVGLASAEWVISSGASTTAITPTAIQALEHTVNGSAPSLPGLIIGQACMYVQRKGRTFQQMLFSVFTNKYMSQDMQVTSQHLTNAGIMQFDYQQQFQEQSLLWAVCGDGTLISMTYAMEQKVFAWAKQTTGDDNPDIFISVAVIYGSAGEDDQVWVSVLRNPSNALTCSVEQIWPVDWQTANVGLPALTDAVYADCATIFTQPAIASATFSGLPTFLIGRTVVASIVPAFAPGGIIAIRNLVVGSDLGLGIVTIPNYASIMGPGDVIVIGLPINWYIQPMRLDIDPRMGPTPGLTKSIQKLYLRTLNSVGGQWATPGAPPVGLNALTPQSVQDIQAYPINDYGGGPPPFFPNVPKDVEIDVGGLFGYSLDPQFTIQGYDPLPFYLLGIAIKADVGGAP